MALLAFVVLASFTVLPCSSVQRFRTSGSRLAAQSGYTPQNWYGYSPVEAYKYPLNFTSGYISHQNLGGLGPDAGQETLVFSNIGTVDGAPFDMVMKVASGYTWDGLTEKTSLDTDALIGSFSVATGTHTKVDVHFRDSATNSWVTVPRLFMTLLDVDTGSSGGIETYTLSHVKTAFVSRNTAIDITEGGFPGEKSSSATAFSPKELGSAENPTQAMGLTKEQMDHAVMVEIRDQSHFQFGVRIDSGANYRNVMFSGPSQLALGVPSVCSQPNVLDLASATLGLNNLDGHTSKAPRAMEFKDVLQDSGNSIDLAVSVVDSGYEPYDASKIGLSGNFATINLKGDGKKQGFLFSFTKDGNPWMVNNLIITFADIDEERADGSFEEVSIVSSTGTYYLAPSSEVVATPTTDGFVTFTSSTPGSAKNNPTLDMLDAEQLDKAVTLVFAEPVSEFTVYFTASSTWSAGRNFAFGGDVSLVCG